jgi:adenylate kinase family enzyme
MTKYIAFMGPPGSGKDTAARLIKHELATNSVRLAFADPLKKMAAAGLNETVAWVDANKDYFIPSVELTVRELLQQLGTEACRNINPNFWINLMRHKIYQLQGILDKTNFVLFTDVRFENEYNFVVNDLKGTVVYIDRPDNPTETNLEHASESFATTVKNCGIYDYIITNKEHNLRELSYSLRELLKDIRG